MAFAIPSVASAAPVATKAADTLSRLSATPPSAFANPPVNPPPALSKRPTSAVTALPSFVQAADTVSGKELYSSSSFDFCESKELTTLSAVSSPASAMARKELMGAFIPSATAFIKRGEFSIRLLNSSPRNTPLPSACENCNMADADSAAPAPDKRRLLPTRSVIASVCVCVAPSSFKAGANFEYKPSDSLSGTPFCCAMANRAALAVLNSSCEVVASFRRACNPTYSSAILTIPMAAPPS